MTYEEQLRLNAIIRDLVETDNAVFSADDAEMLAAALTPQRRKTVLWGFVMPRFWRGSSFEGLTNTGHRASSGDDEEPVRATNMPSKLWFGSYAVFRQDSGPDATVYIEDRFADTRSTGEHRAWAVDFRRGQAVCLRRCRATVIDLIFARFTVQRFLRWKAPCRSEAA